MTDKFDKEPADAKPSAAVSKEGGAIPPEAIKAIPVRHYGRWVSGVVVLALVALLVNAFATAEKIQWSAVGDYVFDPTVLAGAGRTLLISVLAMIMGVVWA